MDSCFAASMKPQVLTSTTSASASTARVQPAASSRAASSSESTSFRAQPSVTRLTLRPVAFDAVSCEVGSSAAGWLRLDDTPADYGNCAGGMAPDAGSPSCQPVVFGPGPRLSVTGLVEPAWTAFLPFSVSESPPGLHTNSFTSVSSLHRINMPSCTYIG